MGSRSKNPANGMTGGCWIFHIANILTLFANANNLAIFFIWNILAMSSVVRTSGQLGPILKRLRKAKGWSQQALGQKVGLSQERISVIENQPEKVSLDSLLTVLMALDVEMQIAPRDAGDGMPAKGSW